MDMIQQIRCFVLDMDGTIYLGGELFSFTKDFLATVEETGRQYCFFTNNSSNSQQVYIDRLKRMGIYITPEQMMISSHVMIRFLQKNHTGKSIYVVGTPSLIEEFRSFGMLLVDEEPDIVVLGFDTTLTYEKLSKACRFIRHGCIYYGVNPDLNCPIEGGEFIPDCGAMAKLIEASTGRCPEFFGKPSRHTLDYIIEHTGFPEEQIAVVGDRLYTDIAVTKDSKAISILVLTGESTLQDVVRSDVKPDIILESLQNITTLMKTSSK